MPTKEEFQLQQELTAALRAQLIKLLAPDLIQNPRLADALGDRVDDLVASVLADAALETPPTDGGLADIVGIGGDTIKTFGETRHPHGVVSYDETVTSERILAVGDLYYIYQHEKLGVFRTVFKLQELFRAGTVRLSSGDGAFGLYRYDRRQVLRYTRKDRMQAYRRVFGYTNTNPPPGAQPNHSFHGQFVQFMLQVARFFRDKRISEVIRTRAEDPSFGSIAQVRRAGLDMRNNLKHASYGHVNVMRVEVLQLLDEAFRILNQEDILKLFGADNAWDAIEIVSERYLNRPQINASQRSRMAVTGRAVIHWLAHPHVIESTRAEFEALLQEVADEAEEWLMSAESLGVARPRAVRAGSNGQGAQVREAEWEFELE